MLIRQSIYTLNLCACFKAITNQLPCHMKSRQLYYSFLILFFLSIMPSATAQETTTTSKIATFKTIEKQYPNSTIDGYNIYLPSSYTKENKDFPILIFLQGGLGVGGEVDKIYNWTLPKMLKDAETLDNELRTLVADTFIVLMPHISEGQFYNNTVALKPFLMKLKIHIQ